VTVEGVDVATVAQVSPEEGAAGAQDAVDLGEECLHRVVAVRGLDVDDGVERLVGKGHGLRVAVDKDQAGLPP